MSLKDGYHRPNQLVFKAPVKEKKSVVVNGIDLLENVPPRTENEVCVELMLGSASWPAVQTGFAGQLPGMNLCNCVTVIWIFLQKICLIPAKYPSVKSHSIINNYAANRMMKL